MALAAYSAHRQIAVRAGRSKSMTKQIRRILVAAGDLQRAPRDELNRAAALGAR